MDKPQPLKLPKEEPLESVIIPVNYLEVMPPGTVFLNPQGPTQIRFRNTATFRIMWMLKSTRSISMHIDRVMGSLAPGESTVLQATIKLTEGQRSFGDGDHLTVLVLPVEDARAVPDEFWSRENKDTAQRVEIKIGLIIPKTAAVYKQKHNVVLKRRIETSTESSDLKIVVATDPTSLGKRFEQNPIQTVGAVREALKPHALAIDDRYKTSIKDLDMPMTPNAAPVLLESYIWTCVCLMAFTVSRIVGGIALYGIIDTWAALLITYAVLPVYVFLYLRKVQMSEMEREQTVLFASMAEGAMVGALFNNRYLSIYGPPVVGLTLIMGLMAHFAGSKDQVLGNRRFFLGALVGGALAGFAVFGFVFNFSFAYIIYVAILGVAAGVDLQLKLASIQRGDTSVQLEQWKTVVIITFASAVGNYMASTTKEIAVEQTEKFNAAK